MQLREVTLFAADGVMRDGLLGELGRAYLAGPMKGMAEHNFPQFDEAAGVLRSWGVDVVNPAEFGRKAGVNSSWADCMRHDLTALLKCDSIVTLPQWRDSTGASLEVQVAKSLSFPVFELDKHLIPGRRWALVAKLT